MDGWQQAAVIIGCLGGAIGIIQGIYFFGSWKGKMTTMVETMWDIYVKDALSKRPDLATHNSPYKLTKEVEDKIPSNIRDRLTDIRCQFKKKENIVSGYTVAQELGSEIIEKTAADMELGIQETIAVLSTYLLNHPNYSH
jgi:hypothetical protein